MKEKLKVFILEMPISCFSLPFFSGFVATRVSAQNKISKRCLFQRFSKRFKSNVPQ